MRKQVVSNWVHPGLFHTAACCWDSGVLCSSNVGIGGVVMIELPILSGSEYVFKILYSCLGLPQISIPILCALGLGSILLGISEWECVKEKSAYIEKAAWCLLISCIILAAIAAVEVICYCCDNAVYWFITNVRIT